jgi:hypothetical protein
VIKLINSVAERVNQVWSEISWSLWF